MNSTAYTIRKLEVTDVWAYKTLRLEALAKEPGLFSATRAVEAAYTEGQWLARLNGEDRAIFGLFHHTVLVGITGVLQEGSTAHCTQSYICIAHRGKGLSRMFYEIRIEWARRRGIKMMITAHRRSNQSSMRANQHFGFRYTHFLKQQWPDGRTDDILYYELELS